MVTLTNRGTKPYVVGGYPEVTILDRQHRPLHVTVHHDSSYMAIDPGPKRIALAPGDSVKGVISWAATVTHGEVNITAWSRELAR